MGVYLKPVTITRLFISQPSQPGGLAWGEIERGTLRGGPGGWFVAFGDGELSGGVRGGV